MMPMMERICNVLKKKHNSYFAGSIFIRPRILSLKYSQVYERSHTCINIYSYTVLGHSSYIMGFSTMLPNYHNLHFRRFSYILLVLSDHDSRFLVVAYMLIFIIYSSSCIAF